jgi:class 3 adenylate cyclase/predicted ATPase
MFDKVSEWLAKLGLEQYSSNFIDNDIDYQLLISLTNDDLKDIGVASLGHRKRILDAIAAIDQQTIKPNVDTAFRGEAERRQLTVMFCDLVNSTELSQRLDPEDLREVNRVYQDACKAGIERFEGYIARYMGDGVLAYFGYPQAHEDDAERAIRAGLMLVKTIKAIETPFTSKSKEFLSVRVGIATGPVVVGDLIGEGASQESAVVGETPNLAARLEAIASTNAVVVSTTTRALAGGLFEYHDLGEHDLKGIENPVSVWRVDGEGKTVSRYHAKHSGFVSTLVGREEEFELLQRRWQKSCKGHGEVVLLCGEAGIGKSRLTQAIDEFSSTATNNILRYQCSPHYTNSSLFPVIAKLETYFNFGKEMSADEKLNTIESRLLTVGLVVEESAALISSLLSIPPGDRYGVSSATPQQQKNQTLEVLSNHIFALSDRQPVLILFEDAHWADPTSLEFLDLIVRGLANRPVMLVINYRPEFQPAWIGEANVSVLSLNKLSLENCTPMIAGIAGGKSLPEQVIQQIMQRTDGVPLFVEELTKTITDSGFLKETDEGYLLEGDLDQLAIPNTLHDSLMARLDRLGSAKELAQIGAVVGREFSYELIQAVYEQGMLSCDQALEKLLQAGLIFKRGNPPEATYTFKHALIQDAAYASLLKSSCKEIHLRIASKLIEKFPLVVETQPELIAHHYSEAMKYSEALGYWQRAARRAMERSANLGAIAYLNKAIAFFEYLPDSTAQQKFELELQILLMTASIAAIGYGAPETVRVMNRVNELAEIFPASPLIYPALYSQWVLRIIRAEIAQARVVARKLLDLANQQVEVPPKIMGNRMFGISLMYEGDLKDSNPYVDKAIALYDHKEHTGLTYQFGQNPLCATYAHKAVLNQFQGNLDISMNCGEQTVEYARKIEHSNTIAYAIVYGVIVPSMCRRDIPRIETASRDLIDVSTEHNLPMWLGSAHSYRGWAMYHGGNREAGVAETRRGLDMYFGGGARLDQLLPLAMLAEYEVSSGNHDAGLQIIDDAISQSENGGERCYLAELYRVKGTLFAENPDENGQTEQYFQKSLEIACEQGAKWWELRTRTSQLRLLQEQGRPEQGYQQLMELYQWFTSGFDLPDLIEAKELLEQLR